MREGVKVTEYPGVAFHSSNKKRRNPIPKSVPSWFSLGTDMMITGPQELCNAGSLIETSLTGPELRCSGLAHHSHRTVQSDTRKAVPFLKLVAAEHLG
ncbi:hypothetical protein MRX96_017965 [Rhipicephalus microplus]